MPTPTRWRRQAASTSPRMSIFRRWRRPLRAGARVFGPLDQAAFLRNLGIESRAAVLRKAVPASKVPEIDTALERLTSTTHLGMGRLFKVMGFAHSELGALPAF